MVCFGVYQEVRKDDKDMPKREQIAQKHDYHADRERTKQAEECQVETAVQDAQLTAVHDREEALSEHVSGGLLHIDQTLGYLALAS